MNEASDGPIRLMVCAGEVSGDIYAAGLVRQLRRIFAPRPVEIVSGIGGEGLSSLGAKLRAHVDQTGVIGLWEVVRRFRFFSHLLRELEGDVSALRPDALITVDYPGLNLRLAKFAKSCGVPAIHWVCPQVWAWRRGRIPKIAESLDLLLAFFPFEPQLFKGTGLDVRFSGHPLVDEIEAFKRETTAPLPWKDGIRIALLAGSRAGEVRRLLPAILAGAAMAEKTLGKCSFLMPAPDETRAAEIRAGVNAARCRPENIDIVVGRSRQVLLEARAGIVKSGTSTLEAALLGCPHAIVYKVSPVTYHIMRHLLTGVSHIGLPNIVAGRTVCTELVQNAASPGAIRDEIVFLATNETRRRRIIADFEEIRNSLGGEGATRRAAEIIARALSGDQALQTIQ
jgi:lipid-A-disaccharide synthase